MSGTTNAPRGRIDEAWRALLAAVDQIPETRQTEPGAAGSWSVKDLLGHIAYWDTNTASRVRSVTAGQPAAPWPDFEPINLEQAERRSAWPLDEIRRELHQAHAALTDALGAADAAGVSVDPAVVQGATCEHYDEHRADLQAYQERLGR